MPDILKDRVPPHNDDAERAVLGAMLLDSEALITASEKLFEKNFYSPRNQRIYKAILSLYNTGTSADLLTLREELRKEGQLEAAGGEAYIAELTNAVQTTANIEYYCKLVRDCSLRREIIRAAYNAISEAFDDENEAEQTLDQTERSVLELETNRSVKQYRKTSEVIPEVIAKIEENYNRKGGLSGVPSGFPDLDRVTAGFQKQDLIIIGARPSDGKTALALSMAKHITVSKGIPAAFFTLEMPDVQLGMRLLASEARIDSYSLRNGLLNSEQYKGLFAAAGLIHGAPLYIVDVPNMEMGALRSQARRLRHQEKIEILFIDYIGLIGLAGTSPSTPRHLVIGEISRSLKNLAREIDIPIVALSQLNRQSIEKGEKKRPDISNLRESGSLEQDADLVMLIHRDKTAEEEAQQGGKEGIETKLIIAKHRNGETRDIDLVFQKKFTLYVNEAKEH